MAEMSQEIMNMVNSNFCYWATSNSEGMPNISMQGSTTAISPDTILMIPRFKEKTFENLRNNPKASVIVLTGLPHDKTKATNDTLSVITGFQIKGSVSVLTSGELFEQTKQLVAQQISPKMAEVMEQSVLLKVEEIYLVGMDPTKRIG